MQMEFEANSVTIRVASEITSELAIALRTAFRCATGYYGYRKIVIEIDSTGGDVHALSAILQEIKRLQVRGITVAGSGLMHTCSAAAILLSMCNVGHRSVGCHTNLLYHNGRMVQSAESELTALKASALLDRLNRADLGMQSMLVQHMLEGTDSIEGFLAHGVQRCNYYAKSAAEIESQLGRYSCMFVGDSMNTPKVTNFRLPEWHRKLVSAYQKSGSSKSLKPLVSYISNLFASDRSVPLAQAWCAQLIDKVEDTSLCELTLEPGNHPSDTPMRRQRDNQSA